MSRPIRNRTCTRSLGEAKNRHSAEVPSHRVGVEQDPTKAICGIRREVRPGAQDSQISRSELHNVVESDWTTGAPGHR